MSWDVRLAPGRRRRVTGRLTFLALALAIPTGAPCAQSPIQLRPGVVLTYVTHNFDQPQDREFNVTIDSVTPDETVFVEDLPYTGPDGKSVTRPYRRHQSRRELSKAMMIDEGTGCNPADTVDTHYRGSTLRMASQRLLRQLKSAGQADVGTWYIYNCSQGLPIQGTIRRVEPGLVPMSILLNDQRLDLKTIHAQGTLRASGMTIDHDYWFLDDSVHPWAIRNEGRARGKTYLMQLGRIVDPAEAAKRMAQALGGERPGADNMCRMPVYGIYFEFASAEVKGMSQPTLTQIATVMQQHPDWILTIEGHTDSVGGAEKNLDLSNRRSAAVRNELVQHYGVAPSRLAVKGYGLARPVEANSTLEGRARNRRVELARKCS